MKTQYLDEHLYNTYTPAELNGWFVLTDNVHFKLSQGHFKTWPPGTFVHLKDGVPHANHFPAIVEKDLRNAHYFHEGYAHRENGFAQINYKNKMIWNGTYFVPDPLDSEIYKFRCLHKDKLHSYEGAAEFCSYDYAQNKYYIDGERVKKQDFHKHPEVIKIKTKRKLQQKMNKLFSQNNATSTK